jgi:hypothetical protein
MTPQEKAKELIEKYEGELVVRTTYGTPKGCAYIAVNEIIEQWEYIDTYLADGRGELTPNLKYWYEVKKWIEAS